jgi:hypothetical protein
MTVDFECTERDIRELNHFFITTPTGKREMLRIYFRQAISLYFAALGFATILQYIKTGGFHSGVFMLSLFATVLGFIANLLLRNYNQNIFTKNAIKRGVYIFNLGRITVSISPEGVSHQGHYGSTVFFWSCISVVHETERHFYLQASPVHFVLVPKRAFTDATHGAEFLRHIEQYRQQATGEPIPQTTRGAWWTQGSAVTEEPQENRNL